MIQPSLLARALLPLLALGLAAPARAADIGAAAHDSHITSVTLYPGSATVERVQRIARGAREAVFLCLPAGLDAASLQARGGAGIEVGEVSLRQQPRALLGDACASPQEVRIRALQDQIAKLKAESTAIDYATGYLRRFGGGADDSDRAREGTADQVSAVVQALESSGQQALLRQHELARQQEALERELKPLEAERDRSGGADQPVSTVRIALAATQDGELHLSYQMRGLGWHPAYRAELDSNRDRITLARLALVAQSTGEDWDHVHLVLSTGQPSAASQAPLPPPWRVGIRPPRPEASAMETAPAAAPALRSFSKSADEGGARASFDVGIFQGVFATEFNVPQPVSVPSNGQQVTLRLGEEALPAKLLTRTTPAADEHAYLVAQFARPGGVWPAGTVRLYRDDAFVGSTRFDATRSARDGLSFGRDDRVVVRAERPEHQQGERGIIGKRTQRVDERRYTVENRHTKGIRLQVLDAAPVSENEDVRVDSVYQPQPATRDWNDQRGTVAWEQDLAAGARQEFDATHTISWPRDEELDERR